MRSEVARSLTYRQRAGERMCRFGTKNPLISVIAPDERTSKHVGSRTPTATRAFPLMFSTRGDRANAGGDQALPGAGRRQGSSLARALRATVLTPACAQRAKAVAADIHQPVP